ncbi:hypothetical protein TH606_02170 [Thermodesulfatator autotrophicus]|uniref:Uncharacterized protein n=1 Tax=Thermodesulfatator autotrophicus TaxID=1795632 RepID=A0A177E9M3_9BACT|nr:hypothetical protein TH606_02170 [Thermodesulfatator autotrophicus]
MVGRGGLEPPTYGLRGNFESEIVKVFERKSPKSRDRNCPQTVPKCPQRGEHPESLVYQGKEHKF